MFESGQGITGVIPDNVRYRHAGRGLDLDIGVRKTAVVAGRPSGGRWLDFPTPIMPTSTIERRPKAAEISASWRVPLVPVEAVSGI